MGNQVSSDRPDPDRPNADRPDAPPARRHRRQVPPDDRLTTILPPVTDDRSPRRADSVEEVKAALDAPPSKPLQRDAIDEVKAALDSRAATPPRRHRPSPGGEPPGGPPTPPWRRGGSNGPGDGGFGGRADRNWTQQINWLWVRRAAYLSAAVLVLLPIVTFAMAYFIVDIPKPGDLR
ncbi:MAG: penicillin-binding protein, partial [Mycobacterium sp.]